jgi:hypothetical protein
MPVLFVLEDDSPEGVARLIEAEADDCLAAPFETSDLLARITRLFRLMWQRHGMTVHSGGSSFRVDLVRRCAHVGGREIALSGLEYRTLWVLAQSRGGVPRFRDIERRVWENAACSQRMALRFATHGTTSRDPESPAEADRTFEPEATVEGRAACRISTCSGQYRLAKREVALSSLVS